MVTATDNATTNWVQPPVIDNATTNWIEPPVDEVKTVRVQRTIPVTVPTEQRIEGHRVAVYSGQTLGGKALSSLGSIEGHLCNMLPQGQERALLLSQVDAMKRSYGDDPDEREIAIEELPPELPEEKLVDLDRLIAQALREMRILFHDISKVCQHDAVTYIIKSLEELDELEKVYKSDRTKGVAIAIGLITILGGVLGVAAGTASITQMAMLGVPKAHEILSSLMSISTIVTQSASGIQSLSKPAEGEQELNKQLLSKKMDSNDAQRSQSMTSKQHSYDLAKSCGERLSQIWQAHERAIGSVLGAA